MKTYYSTETAPDSSSRPTLWVMYETGFAGIQDYWTYVDFPLGDGQVARVNVAAGNLVLKHRDWNLTSVGIDTVVDRIYNQNDLGNHDFGYHTMMSIHTELSSFPTTTPRPLMFFDPGATWYIFEPYPDISGNFAGYYRPRGLNAELEKTGTDYFVKYDDGLTFKFDSSYRLLSIYDRNANTVNFYYDPNGKINLITDTAGRNINISRDASGYINQIGDILGRTTAYTVDPQNNNAPSTFTNQRGYTTQYTYFSGGTGMGIKDPKQQSGIYNTAEVTFIPTAGLGSAVSSFSYINANGQKDTYNFTYDTTYHKTTVTDPRGNSTVYTWDLKSGVVTEIKDAANNSEKREYGPHFNLKKTIDRQNNIWLREYDGNDIRLISTTDPLNVVTSSYQYSNINNPYYPTKLTDEQGNYDDYNYDDNGNMISIYSRLNGEDWWAYYHYNVNGTTDYFIDPRGKITWYYYTDDYGIQDQYWRLRKIVDPLGLTIKMEYDNASRMTAKTDARGQVTTYAYDNQDNITSITYHDGSSITFSYDANGNQQQMTDSYGNTTFEYDYRNQLLRKTLPGGILLDYGYDQSANLIAKNDSGVLTQYQYDDRNLLWKVIDPEGYITFVDYYLDYTIKKTTYPTSTAVTADYEWNDANRLTKIINKSGSTVLSSFTYSYNKPGFGQTTLRYSVIDKDNNETYYNYDELDHLIQANSPGINRSWLYDTNGNRLSQTINGATTNYMYDDASRLTQAGNITYSWDNNGNLVWRSDGLNITYNAADKSTSINGVAMDYTSRDQTQRVSKGSSLSYIYDGSSTGPSVQKETGQLDKHFITTPSGMLMGMYVGNPPNGQRYYFLFDGIGSVVGMVDSSGSQVNSYTYEPFGSIASQVEAVSQPYKFHGAYCDSDTGFYKMGARYYDPEVGRFTQPEPAWSNPMFNSIGGRNLLTERVFATAATMGQELIPMPQGIYLPASDYNWYSYACSDPVNNSDIAGYWNWRKVYGGVLILGGLCSMGIGAASFVFAPSPLTAIVFAGGFYSGLSLIFTGINTIYERQLMPDLPLLPL